MDEIIDVEESNEEFLLRQARLHKASNQVVANTWIITARNLFPNNFEIQYEGFCIEKAASNVQEAARCFTDLIINFLQKPAVWKEVQAVIASLIVDQCDYSDSERVFYTNMFKHLSADTQQTVLLHAANNVEDNGRHTKLVMMILNKFPGTLPKYAPRLISALFAADAHLERSNDKEYTILNQFRRTLVLELLPLMASAQESVSLPQEIWQRLLQYSIEYYITHLSLANNSIEIVAEPEMKIDDPWSKLFLLVEFIVSQLDPNSASPHISYQNISKEVYWQKLSNYNSSGKWTIADRSSSICASVFFLRCLHDYKASLTFKVSPGQPQIRYMLVEAFTDPELPISPEEQVMKKRKLEDVHVSVEKTELKSLSSNLSMAVNCWLLLSSQDYLRNEFSTMNTYLKLDRLLGDFIIDFYLYKAQYELALKSLQNKSTEIVHSAQTQLMTIVRIASIYYCNKAYRECYEQMLVALPLLGSVQPGAISMHLIRGGTARHLHFLPVTANAVMQYCSKVLLRCISKNSSKISHHYPEMAIGHMLVLSQFDAPQENNIVEPLLERIKTHGSFSYALFQDYIIDINILEEITYLWRDPKISITLDIIPHIGQRPISTRGSDKALKEEIKQLIYRQIARNNDNLFDLTLRFISNEAHYILPVLL